MVADDGVNIGNASMRFDSVEWLRTGLSLVLIHLPLLLLTYILLINLYYYRHRDLHRRKQ